MRRLARSSYEMGFYNNITVQNVVMPGNEHVSGKVYLFGLMQKF